VVVVFPFPFRVFVVDYEIDFDSDRKKDSNDDSHIHYPNPSSFRRRGGPPDVYNYTKKDGTHFFLTVKGIGQMIAEKRDSSDMRRAKHTICQLALGRSRELTGVVEL